MNTSLVKQAVIDKLRSLEIGVVEGKEGRTTGLPWESTTGVLPLWTVKATHVGLAQGVQQPSVPKLYEWIFQIKGYFPHNFEADSEIRWDEYWNKVMDGLKKDPAIDPDVSARTLSPVLQINNFVKYKSTSGETLCHYVIIEFRAQRWVNTGG